jgi:hypothetical protein
MFQTSIKKGSREVIISANTDAGPFSSRLYVNNGETATLVAAKAKTLKGARKQAEKMLDGWGGTES